MTLIFFFFRLPESVKEILGSKKSDQIAAAIDELYAESGSTTQMIIDASRPGPEGNREERTLCRPVFEEGDQPLNHMKHFNFPTQLPQVEFETTKVILGMKVANMIGVTFFWLVCTLPLLLKVVSYFFLLGSTRAAKRQTSWSRSS